MYHLAKLFQKVLQKLPLSLVYALGASIGIILYFNAKKRQIAFKNIKSVFPEKTNKEIQAIIRKSFVHLGLGIIEGLIAERIFKYVYIEKKEDISADGAILAAIHEGSWELYNFFIAREFKYKMFAKEQKTRGLDKFLNELRQHYKLDVCFSLKDTVRSLRNGYLIGMVMDHGAEENALVVDFFTHSVPTPKGALYLSQKLNKKIYPCFGYRVRGFRHVIEIGESIEIDIDPAQTLRNLNKIYESYLKKYPWEYLWFYKRFKRKKDLDILILSDAKPGHLKQSQAFLSIFKEEEGLKIRSKIIEVKPLSRPRKMLCEICAFFSPKAGIGCLGCVKLSVGNKTTQELEKTYADIVVSAGSAVAPVNKMVSCSLCAKSVVILRPNTPLRKFDLSILPAHDRISAKNTVTIKGALSYPFNIKEKTQDCQKFFNLTADKKIAFFLGGYLSDEKAYIKNLLYFSKKLKDFSLKQNYKILISTSRRTQKEIENFIEQEFSNFKNLEALVYSNRQNYDFVFDGFAALSEIVFVSCESISMISEVISFKKPCVCVILEKHLDKHKVFLQSIENDVSLLDMPYDIQEIKPVVSAIFEDNKKAVKEGIRRLL